MGQMRAVLAAAGVPLPVVDLLADAPLFDPGAAAYLLAAVAGHMPGGNLCVAVVDPGVGGERRPLVVKTARNWYVGPDNGLLSQVLRREPEPEVRTIDWRPSSLSASFHGRDLFAAVAAMICKGEPVPGEPVSPEQMVGFDWPDDLFRVIYIDHYGNAYTGIRASVVDRTKKLIVNGRPVAWARTFSDVPVSAPFWYENANGLVEIAVNQGRADRELGVEPGTEVVLSLRPE
jgi:S-adenosylmethionine hydrolase